MLLSLGDRIASSIQADLDQFRSLPSLDALSKAIGISIQREGAVPGILLDVVAVFGGQIVSVLGINIFRLFVDLNGKHDQ